MTENAGTTEDAVTALFGDVVAQPQGPTTERILDAAPAQFVDFGLRRTSMDDVAKRAGVARVTVYRRFQNRAGVRDADPAPAAEIMVRVVMSFLLNPTSCVDLADDAATRSFARRCLAPMLGR